MKISLALGNRDSLDRQTAQACVATNLGLPGFGSLLAGRAVGYVQAALTLAGFGLTLLLGVKFIVWAVINWPRLYGPEADPLESLLSMWLNVRGALLGIALFVVSWLWALVTNFSILRSASRKQDAAKPPKLNPT
jgi:hypothetical protein